MQNARPDAATRTSFYDKKLEHVLAAAARVIARDSYGRASIRQVAKEAGMSLSGLYYYFSSKDELLFLLQLHRFDSIVADLSARLDGVTDPRERLRIVVTNHLEHFLSNMDELKVCVHEMESLEGEYYRRVLNLRREYFRITLEVVESIARAEGVSVVQPRLATLYLFGMLNWIYMWYPSESEISEGDLADQAVTLFLEGFLPRRKAAGTAKKGENAHV
jgi:TetR/AcrR family transcriptional regulator, cholesterol catabolism regulator